MGDADILKDRKQKMETSCCWKFRPVQDLAATGTMEDEVKSWG